MQAVSDSACLSLSLKVMSKAAYRRHAHLIIALVELLTSFIKQKLIAQHIHNL
jgi:hypothetical protein